MVVMVSDASGTAREALAPSTRSASWLRLPQNFHAARISYMSRRLARVKYHDRLDAQGLMRKSKR